MAANSLNFLDELIDDSFGVVGTPTPVDLLDFDFAPAAPQPFEPAGLTHDPLLSDLSDNSVVVLPARLSEHIESPSDSQFPWSPKFTLDLALGFDKEEDILLRHNVDSATFERIKKLPAFRRDLAMAMASIREEGLTFKTKCRMISEEYLDEIYHQITDPGVGVGQRFDMFKKLVQLGGLEPKEDKATADPFAGLPRIAISINL